MVHNPRASRTTGSSQGVEGSSLLVARVCLVWESNSSWSRARLGKNWRLINATARYPVHRSLHALQRSSRHIDLRQALDGYLAGRMQALAVASPGAYGPINSRDRRCCFTKHCLPFAPTSLSSLFGTRTLQVYGRARVWAFRLMSAPWTLPEQGPAPPSPFAGRLSFL